MKKKILYIEDDEKNRALVQRILAAKGYEVFEAETGLEGLEKAKACKPDMILMDINMPGLDGYETTTRLKGMEALKDVPIIALTARISAEDKERGLIAGCSGYLTKPIVIDTFAEMVERYLGGETEKVDEDKEKALLKDYSQYLVKRLEDKVQLLQRANEDLEKKVDERTRELKKAQKRLVKMEKIKALQEVMGAAAHELNQPLTVILSLAEVLQNNIDKDDDNYEMLEKIKDECSRAAEIVKKVGSITDYRTKTYYQGTEIIDLDESSS